jgi:hypothetical protein
MHTTQVRLQTAPLTAEGKPALAPIAKASGISTLPGCYWIEIFSDEHMSELQNLSDTALPQAA